MINKLGKSNIGEWVRYTPNDEIGRIKSFDNEKKIAWVVYKANNDWKHFESYTAASTKYEDLKLLGMVSFSEYFAKRLSNMNWKAEYLLEYRLNKQKKGLRNIRYVKLKWAYKKFTSLKDKCNYLQLVKFEEGYKPNIIFKI